MNALELLAKVNESKLQSYPFPYFLIRNSFSEHELNLILEEIEALEKTQPTSIFESNFGQKKEWKKFPENFHNLNNLLNFLASK